MEKVLFTLAESGSISGTKVLYLAIAIVLLAIAGYLLLRKKKK